MIWMIQTIRRQKTAQCWACRMKVFLREQVKIGERTIDGTQLKWSVFHDFPADRMYSSNAGMGIPIY